MHEVLAPLATLGQLSWVNRGSVSLSVGIGHPALGLFKPSHVTIVTEFWDLFIPHLLLELKDDSAEIDDVPRLLGVVPVDDSHGEGTVRLSVIHNVTLVKVSMDDTVVLRRGRDRDRSERCLPSVLDGVPRREGFVDLGVVDSELLLLKAKVSQVGTNSLTNGLVSPPEIFVVVNSLGTSARGELGHGNEQFGVVCLSQVGIDVASNGEGLTDVVDILNGVLGVRVNLIIVWTGLNDDLDASKLGRVDWVVATFDVGKVSGAGPVLVKGGLDFGVVFSVIAERSLGDKSGLK